MKHILALDQGTTSSRAIVFDQSGNVVASAQKEFRQIFPKPGWVEHDAKEIWGTQLHTATEALIKATLAAADIAAIGITNQRETTIVWDRETGEPVHHAIVWQDRRTAAACDRLKARGLAPLIKRKTGLVVDAYFSGTKLEWILRNVPGARAKAKAGKLAFGTVDSWLVWNLTGGRVHVTDPSNASRTMLFNLRTGDWDDELLKLFGVPRSVLPAVRSSSEVYGETALFGRGRAVPIAGIAGDQQAALFGQACTQPGMVKNTYGTGCFMLMNTGTKPIASKNNLLTTVAWRIGKRTEYALEGSIFIAGAVVQWLRDGLGIIKSSSEVEALAAQVADPEGVYLVPAFAGLGARARGARRHRVPGRRRAARDGSRRAHQVERAARGRRRLGEQSPDAVPVEPARRSRRAAQGDRNHGPGGRLSRGARRRLLEGSETDRGTMAGGPPVHARDASRAAQAAREGLAQGARPGTPLGRRELRGLHGSRHQADL